MTAFDTSFNKHFDNSAANIAALADTYANQHPAEILAFALSSIENIAISFSGAEDVVLIDMASKINPNINIFCLNTGRLHEETLSFIAKVTEHYGLPIESVEPNQELLAAFVAEKGLFSFYETGHKECCSVRKTGPLRRKLAELKGWITGQRKDQSPNTRNHIDVIEIDSAFSLEGSPLIKFNPLANWTSEQVWAYIHENDVPYNQLHDRGYKSIGCEPCTRAIKPGEHERAGRWWWEEATSKECGLHQGNKVSKD